MTYFLARILSRWLHCPLKYRRMKPGVIPVLLTLLLNTLQVLSMWPNSVFYPSSPPHSHCHRSSPINLYFCLCHCTILTSLFAFTLDLPQSDFYSATRVKQWFIKLYPSITCCGLKQWISTSLYSDPLALIPGQTSSSHSYSLQQPWCFPIIRFHFCFL